VPAILDGIVGSPVQQARNIHPSISEARLCFTNYSILFRSKRACASQPPLYYSGKRRISEGYKCGTGGESVCEIFSKDVFKQGSSVGCRDFRRHTPSRIGAIGAYVYEPIIQDVRNLEIEARMNTVLFSHPTGLQICNPRVSTKIERQGALSTGHDLSADLA
jgi:hypothetical protein